MATVPATKKPTVECLIRKTQYYDRTKAKVQVTRKDGTAGESFPKYDAHEAVIVNGRSELVLSEKRLETFELLGVPAAKLSAMRAQYDKAVKLTRDANPDMVETTRQSGEDIIDRVAL
jgi:hypothetical protein